MMKISDRVFGEGRPVTCKKMTTLDTTSCSFSSSCPVNYLIIILISHRQVTDKSPWCAHVGAFAVLVSPSLPPAEEASRELPYPCSYPGNFSDPTGGCQFWFCSESKLSCHASGCKRFHDDWNGYCPQHPWSRWVKCTDVLKTAPRLREAEFGGQKIPNHARFVMRSHGCLWRLWLSTLRYTEFLLAFAAVPKAILDIWMIQVYIRTYILAYRHDEPTVPYIMVGFLQMDLSSRSVRLGTLVSWCCSLWLKLPWSWIAVGCWLCCCCRCSWEASKDGFRWWSRWKQMFFGLWSPMISMFRTNPAM